MNGFDKIVKWLENAKNDRPYQYLYIYKMVQEHPKRHGYPSIEEYLEKHPYLIPNE